MSKLTAKSGNGYSLALGKDTWIITHRTLLGAELWNWSIFGHDPFILDLWISKSASCSQ